MLVKDLMSKPVVTVLDTTTVGECLDVLKKNNIKHLPVVNPKNALVGVASETDLLKVFPNSKELSTFQVNLLSRTPVSKVMKTCVISASPGEIVEEAALLMRVNRISCLPVLDDDKKLVGILSKNDILDAFISSLGLGEEGTRITIKSKKKWGFLSELIAFADKRSIQIDNIVTFNSELVLKVKGKAVEFVDDLQKAGYNVIDVSFIKPPAAGENCSIPLDA